MIYFRKPFQIVPEENWGMVPYAIVVMQKRPEMYHARVLPREEAKKKRYAVEQVVTQYSYYLQIDLWLLVLSFKWKSKELVV